MRQIYLLALEADAEAADGIEAMLKQRGYMVRRAEEKFAFPPARPQEITLALWSRAAQMSAKQILFTNRAIDAWTEGRLIFARLDHALQPRGLADLAAIDMSFAPGRIASIAKVVEAAREIDNVMAEQRREDASVPDGGGGNGELPGPDKESDGADMPGAPIKRGSGKRGSGQAGFSPGAAVIVGVVAAAALGSMGFLVMPMASTFLVAGAALAWGGVAGAIAGFFAGGPRGAARSAPLPAEASEQDSMPAPAPRGAASEGDPAVGEVPAAGPSAVFVSYSRHDGAVVYPMVAEVEASGREVWIDKNAIHPGSNWAGIIVRAIRDSDTFCLMCSAESFQSDNVRREIYIADKYKRKLLPVRLDFAEMPEDFEYFLIDRQWLDLTTVAPDERAIRLNAALAAAD